ncbi:MAG: HIT domain-containing protein [Planctomycetota bacterium]
MTSRRLPSAHEPDPPGPDAIWAPWRLDYLESLDEDDAKPSAAPAAAETNPTPKPAGGSFLSEYWQNPARDETNHVFYRDEHGMILLNRYPYSNGHLLVALGDARPSLLDYNATQRAALWSLVDHAMALLLEAIEPQGVNVGVNQGRAAGAGVPSHLHVHLVPRWGGDVNFMTTTGGIRVVPSSLDAMAARLRRAADKLERDR